MKDIVWDVAKTGIWTVVSGDLMVERGVVVSTWNLAREATSARDGDKAVHMRL